MPRSPPFSSGGKVKGQGHIPHDVIIKWNAWSHLRRNGGCNVDRNYTFTTFVLGVGLHLERLHYLSFYFITVFFIFICLANDLIRPTNMGQNERARCSICVGCFKSIRSYPLKCDYNDGDDHLLRPDISISNAAKCKAKSHASAHLYHAVGRRVGQRATSVQLWLLALVCYLLASLVALRCWQADRKEYYTSSSALGLCKPRNFTRDWLRGYSNTRVFVWNRKFEIQQWNKNNKTNQIGTSTHEIIELSDY